MTNLFVSDHAVLRYLERVGGFEIAQLRREMAERLRPFAASGATGVVIDGYIYVIDDRAEGRVVTTVLPRGRSHQGLAPSGKMTETNQP